MSHLSKEAIDRRKQLDAEMAQRMGWRELEDLGHNVVGYRPDHPSGRGKLPVLRVSSESSSAHKLLSWLLQHPQIRSVNVEFSGEWTAVEILPRTMVGPAGTGFSAGTEGFAMQLTLAAQRLFRLMDGLSTEEAARVTDAMTQELIAFMATHRFQDEADDVAVLAPT
jgi:hypothetical protein